MTIEQFSRSDFEKVLTDANLKWYGLGWLVGDERGYKVELDEHSFIKIRSSIHSNGQSADTGKDSICCWLVTDKDESIISKPAAQKIQDEHYITRIPGWQERLIKKIEYLRLLKLNIGNCRECTSPRIVLVSRTPKNPGRLFSKCSQCGAWGNWLDPDVLQNLGKQTSVFGGAIGKLTVNETQDWRALTGANKITPSEKVASSENISDAVTEIDMTKNSPISDSIEPQPQVENPKSENAFTNGLVGFLESESLKTEETAPIIVKKEFKSSKYNEAVLDAFLHTDRHLQIKARAGSGKTSQNIWLLSHIPEKSIDVEMLVFGKPQQLEMVERVPEWIKARTRTSHAFGFDMVCKHFGIKNKREFAERGQRKTWELFKEHFPYGSEVQNDYAPINKLLSLCKNSLREPNKENLDYLCERFDVVTNGNTDAIYDAVSTLWKASIDSLERMCDLDDMLFAPAYGLVPVEKRDVLFVDEYQDNNDAQRALYLKTGARIIYVGDEFQSIFGFRGAMLGAMQEMEKELNALTLPLPVSYRCAKSIIALAQTIVPDILPRDDAPEGLIDYQGKLSQVKPGDAVLCRNNAPLVEPCFRLIRDGVKATIRGRDIGTNLMNLVKRVEKKTFSSSFIALLGAIQDYTDAESTKLEIAHKESQAASLRDQCETIQVLADSCHSVKDLSDKVDTIFSDKVEGVVFSTIHKYKGLESSRVFCLNPELMSAQKYDTKDWNIEQLSHLKYVCITRAKQELHFIQE